MQYKSKWGECALNKRTGAGLTLIKYGIQRSATGQKKPHAVDLTFIWISCEIPAQKVENPLLTASAKCKVLWALEPPQISLLSKLWFDKKKRLAKPSVHCWRFHMQVVPWECMNVNLGERLSFHNPCPLYYMSFNKLVCKEYLPILGPQWVIMQLYLYCKQKENSPWRERKRM